MAYIGKQPTPVPLSASDLDDDIISLAKMAGGTDGNLISYDTSGNPVAVATGSDGQVLTSAGAGNPCLFEAAAGGGGKIGQVVQIVNTATETMTSTTPATISDFTVAITPAATSSKILVMACIATGSNSGYTAAGVQLYRDTTQIMMGDAAGSRSRVSVHGYVGNTREMANATLVYLDSPSTTSEVDYSCKWFVQNTGTIWLNRSHLDTDSVEYHRDASTITAIEVLA